MAAFFVVPSGQAQILSPPYDFPFFVLGAMVLPPPPPPGSSGNLFSETLENRVVEYFFRNQADLQPTTLEFALWQTDPGDGLVPVGLEVVGGGYARVTIATPAAFWSVPAAGQSLNAQVLTFPTATSPWTPANFVVVFDQVSGDYMTRGQIVPAIAVTTGRTLVGPVSSLELQVE